MQWLVAVSEAIRAVGVPGFREPFNSWSHLAAALFCLVMGVRLVWRGPRQRWALGVFVFAAVFLLSMSGTYHLLYEGQGREVLKRLDVAGVFGLIAGTFTPVLALLFRGVARWGTLVVLWLVTGAGIALRTVFFEQSGGVVGLSVFLVMGWGGAGLTYVLWRRFGWSVIAPLVWGGLCYTVGALALGSKWVMLVPGVIEYHELWHVFVLLGLAYHWRFVSRAAWMTVEGPD